MSIPKATHATGVFHVRGQPIPVILDDNDLNIQRYHTFMQDDVEHSVKATEVYEEISDREKIPRGIIITLKIRSKNDIMDFVIIPDDEFVSELIIGKRIYFGNSNGVSFFSFILDTKPIENVWTPSKM